MSAVLCPPKGLRQGQSFCLCSMLSSIKIKYDNFSSSAPIRLIFSSTMAFSPFWLLPVMFVSRFRVPFIYRLIYKRKQRSPCSYHDLMSTYRYLEAMLPLLSFLPVLRGAPCIQSDTNSASLNCQKHPMSLYRRKQMLKVFYRGDFHLGMPPSSSVLTYCYREAKISFLFHQIISLAQNRRCRLYCSRNTHKFF